MIDQSDAEDVAYSHVPPKPVYTVQVMYTHIGRLKPRTIPDDEDAQ